MRKQISPLAKRLFLLGTSVVVSLAIGVTILEIVAVKTSSQQKRWVTPSTRFDPELGWAPIPSTTLNHVWGGKRLTTNRLGFRSPEIDPARRQIAIVGDSVAFGLGLDDSETISAILEQRVANLGFQVQNLGVAGYGTDQQYLYLKRHIDDLPNLAYVVLMIYTGNDLYECAFNTVYGKRKPFFDLYNGELKLRDPTIAKYGLRNLISITPGLGRFVVERQRLPGLLGWLTGDVTRPFDETEPVALALLEAIERLVESRGARLTLVLSPPIVDFDSPTEGYLFFRAAAEASGAPFVDLMTVFREVAGDDLTALYRPNDPAHLSPEGCRIAAATIASELLNLS